MKKISVHAISALILAIIAITGCWRGDDHEVVVYSALDAEFAEPILDQYGADKGVTVRPVFDIESTKTVGLTTRIIGERGRPRCDVFWNNEILHTLRLQTMGLLEAYESPIAKEFPKDYRSSAGYWHGFAARARVLIVNTDLVAPEERPTSIHDLVDPTWKDRVGIAKPLFGSTATHASVLFAVWGDKRAKKFFRELKNNARIMSGNKQVALATARGDLAFGLTDTDDAIIEQEGGRPVAIVYPDQLPGQIGTLFIPNTVCIIKGAPHLNEARKLVDYLLAAEVEERLAQGPSAQFPINPQVDVRSRAASSTPVRWMDVDFEAAAHRWSTTSRFLRDLFAVAD